MRKIILALAVCIWLWFSISCGGRSASGSEGRVITVVQSGTGDVVGSDDAALQKAAGLLRAGDTLSIGPGIYEMNNSLFVPSNVTVRGTAGQTVFRKSRGVESTLAEDGDYGERVLMVTEPHKLRPGMGIAILDDTLKSGWDISISTVTGIEGRMLRISPMTLRDYDAEQLHARVRNTFPILCVT